MGLAALVALVIAASASGTETQGIPGVPNIPGIPSIPHVQLPKPDAKAVFDVVVEGKASDINHSQLSGTTGTCLAEEDGHITETDTYLRGADVRIEFERFGNTIIMKRNRGGQLGETSLALEVKVHRTATGGSTFTPAFPPAPCRVPAVDLSKNADCGKSIPAPDAAMVLGWSGGRLSLDVATKTALGRSPDTCGEDPETGITNALLWAWPKPVALSTGPLPKSEIFGKARSVTVLVHNSDVAPAHADRHVTYGSLSGTVTDTGLNAATVTFKRVG